MPWLEDLRLLIGERWQTGDSFRLADLYGFVPRLRALYPDNRNIEEKIRQTMQQLRDAGAVEFLDNNGSYRVGDYGPAATLPETSREKILVSLGEFDEKLRTTEQWIGWENNRNHLYGIAHEGRLYPVKQIVSMATGRPVTAFSGGNQANRYVEGYGFGIERLRAGPDQGLDLSALKWWVNQGKTYREEKEGGYVWAPMVTRAGATVSYHTNVSALKRGDQLLHYANGTIRAVGTVVAAPIEAPEPSEQSNDSKPQGYLARVAYHQLNKAIPLREIPVELRQEEAGPFDRDGGVKQGYLFPLSDNFATRVRELVASEIDPRSSRATRYWSIAPGEGARLWPEFSKSGIIAIGWDQIGDLSRFATKEEISAALAQARESTTEPVNNSLACYQFAHELKPGDVVFAKRGISEIAGYGVVTGDYEFHPERAEYRSTRTVDWLSVGSWSLPESIRLPMKTLTDVSDYKNFLEFIMPLVNQAEAVQTPQPATLHPYTIDEALEGVFMEGDEFQHIVDTLARKKNIVLQGPPGVGKTFIAKRIAYCLMGYRDRTRVEMVQFHQSYAYEDFVQGWRPTQSGFELRNGIFYDFCCRAREDIDQPYVFIIDEINRGNLSKVLGELMMLIEADKRGSDFAIPLTYSKDKTDRFSVPKNVFLIGLMNTADRSLAMVDYALRRRFGFLRLEPAFSSPKFAEFLQHSGAAKSVTDLVVSRLETLNEEILKDEKNLGPGFEIGHSFFCPQGTEESLDEAWYRGIVEDEIAPLLREYWFDKPSKAEEWIRQLQE